MTGTALAVAGRRRVHARTALVSSGPGGLLLASVIGVEERPDSSLLFDANRRLSHPVDGGIGGHQRRSQGRRRNVRQVSLCRSPTRFIDLGLQDPLSFGIPRRVIRVAGAPGARGRLISQR